VKIGAEMIVGLKSVALRSVHLPDTMVELKLPATIPIAMSVRKHRLRTSEVVEKSLLQVLLQDRVEDVTSLPHHLVLPERCSSPQQGHDHQSTRFGIPTMEG
jgi:hypothetical protein